MARANIAGTRVRRALGRCHQAGCTRKAEFGMYSGKGEEKAFRYYCETHAIQHEMENTHQDE